MVCMRACQVSSVMSYSLRPYGLYPAKLLCPWDSLRKNTGVDCHDLIQGIFLTQEPNLHLLMPHALAGGFFTTSTTWEAQNMLQLELNNLFSYSFAHLKIHFKPNNLSLYDQAFYSFYNLIVLHYSHIKQIPAFVPMLPEIYLSFSAFHL